MTERVAAGSAAATGRLPDFLVIGAMKAGTTSLFFDLRTHPAIHLPDKELNCLASDAVLEASGRDAYAQKFTRATADQLCGDVSTSYAKLPELPGVAQRAKRVLSAGTKIVYLVREPVARTFSHHRHDLLGGAIGPDVDRAVREHPCLIEFSRYAAQVEPWIDAFGTEQVRVLRFEDFVADRRGTAAALSRFLGVEPYTAEIEEDRVFNPADTALARRGRWWQWSRGATYQRWIRPWLPGGMRGRLRRLVLPKAPPRPEPPSIDTVDFVIERVQDDVIRLQQIMGLDAPPWDLEQVRRRWASRG